MSGIKLTVKMVRISAEKTTEEAAKKLGLSRTGYSRKENGHARFYADEILQLAELFGVDYQIFFNDGCRKKTQAEAS